MLFLMQYVLDIEMHVNKKKLTIVTFLRIELDTESVEILSLANPHKLRVLCCAKREHMV